MTRRRRGVRTKACSPRRAEPARSSCGASQTANRGDVAGRSALGHIRGVLPRRLLDRRRRTGRQACQALGGCHWEAGAPATSSHLVVEATFAPSGKALATSAGDGTVRLWEAPSLRHGLALPGPERWSVLGFDPGGNRLAALYDNGTALVWDVNPEHWKKRACAVVGRPLTREEGEELLPRRSYQPACRDCCIEPECAGGSAAKLRLSFTEGHRERVEPLDRAHDLSPLSREVEAVARGDRSMQQCLVAPDRSAWVATEVANLPALAAAYLPSLPWGTTSIRLRSDARLASIIASVAAGHLAAQRPGSWPGR
jgi:hypothetical protein